MIGMTNASKGMDENKWRKGQAVTSVEIPRYLQDGETSAWNVYNDSTKTETNTPTDEAPCYQKIVFTEGALVDLTEAQSAPVIGIDTEDETSATIKGAEKAYGCVSFVKAGDSSLTLYCLNKCPSRNFKISVKGVY